MLSHWGIHLGGEGEALTRSDERGQFLLSGFAPRADWVLYALKEGYAGSFGDPLSTVDGNVDGVTLRVVEGCTVKGHVFDATGAPLPHQGVYVGGRTTLKGGSWRALTDEAGAFVLTSLPASPLTVTAMKGPGARVAVQLTDLKVGEVREGIVLRFGARAVVRGKVRTSSGAPVPRLYLRLRSLKGSPVLQPGYTDAQGNFSIEAQAPGPVELSAVVEGESTVLMSSVEAPAEGVELVFDPPTLTAIRGRVLDPAGEPVPLFDVRVQGTPERASRAAPRGQAGAFEVQALGEAPFTLTIANARRAGDGTPMNCLTKTVLVADPAAPLVIRLDAGGALRGRVIDAQGRGVPGVRVRSGQQVASTDTEGTWGLVGLPAGHLYLHIEVPTGFIPVRPVHAVAGGVDVVTRIARGVSVRGRIVLPDDAAPSFCSVAAVWEPSGEVPGGRASGRVDLTARTFSVEGIPSGVSVRLTFRPHPAKDSTLVLAPAVVEAVAAGARDVEVVLVGGVSVRGVVRDASGDPVAGVTVIARNDAGSAWARTDSAGAFVVSGLLPGEYVVIVRELSHAETRRAGVDVPGPVLRIDLPARGEITGRIQGGPPGLAWRVIASDAEDPRVASVSEIEATSAGAWTLTALAEGRSWRVRARAKGGYYAHVASVQVGARDVVLEAKQGASIEGIVTYDGHPVPRCFIAARSPTWIGGAVTDEAGRFAVEGLPPGGYRLEARAMELSRRGEVEGVAAGASDVAIRLPR